MKRRFLFRIAITILATAVPASALNWDADGIAPVSGGTGVWNTSTPLWEDGAGNYSAWSNAALGSAVFGGSAGTVSLGAEIAAGSLSLNTNGYTIDLSGFNLTITGGTGGTAPALSSTTISNSSGTTVTFSTSSFGSASGPKLSGNMNVTLNGAANWTPAITHDFTGILWLQGSGTVRADENRFLGSASGLIKLDESKILMFGSPNNTQTHTFTRDFELFGATQGFQVNGAKEITMTGSITGSGALRHTSGQGTIVLAGNNSYAGATALVGQNAIFIAQTNTAFGNSSGITTGSGLQQTVGFRGGVAIGAIPLSLIQSAPSSGIPMIHSFGGNNSFAGNITLGSNTTRLLGAEENSTLMLSGVLSGGKGIAKLGAGTIVLTGANTYPTANAVTGNETSINDGTLRLDFSLATFEDSPGVQTNIINHGITTNSNANQVSQLVLGGGALEVVGKPGNTNSQSFKSGSSTTATNVFTILPGVSSVAAIQNSATSLTIDLGKLLPAQRSVGGTVNFNLPAIGAILLPSVAGSVGLNGMILTANGAAFATVAGSDWAGLEPSGSRAIAGGSTIAGFYTPNTATVLAGNADMSGGVDTTLAAPATTSSIRFNDPASRKILLGGQTLTTGGILVTSAVGNNPSTITEGILRGADSATGALQDLVIIQNNLANVLTIGAAITNAANTNATGLTKSGAGTLELTGANVYTGTTTVNAGVLMLRNALALPGGIGSIGGLSNLTFKGGVIGLTGASGNFTRALGTGADQVRFIGSGGFAAYGGDRVVNLGGVGAQITWNSGNFVPTLSALILGASDSDGLVDFQNVLRITAPNQPMPREIRAHNGTAATDAELSANVNGDGGILKTGLGTLELSAANTYIGETVVREGTLLVSGSLSGASAVSVLAGGTLGGNGAMGAVASSGTVAPGLNVGTLTTGAIAFNGGTFAVDLADATTFDTLNVAGGVSFNAPITLTLALSSSVPDGTLFTIIANDGADPLNFANASSRFIYNSATLNEGDEFAVSGAFGSQILEISYAGGTGNDVVLTAIPEPNSAVLLLGGLVALCNSRRPRRRA